MKATCPPCPFIRWQRAKPEQRSQNQTPHARLGQFSNCRFVFLTSVFASVPRLLRRVRKSHGLQNFVNGPGVFSLLKRSLTVFSRSDPDPDTDTDLCCLLFIKLLIHTDRISDIGSVRACAYACEVDCTVFSEF